MHISIIHILDTLYILYILHILYIMGVHALRRIDAIAHWISFSNLQNMFLDSGARRIYPRA